MFAMLRIRRLAVAALVGAGSLALLVQSPAASQAQELKKVRIGVATTNLNIGYPWLMMPQALGYWKEEGLDVEVLPIGGSLQVVQQMVGGGVEVGQINAAVVVQSQSTNDIPIRTFMVNKVLDWTVSVPADSPIQDVKDLKGKQIGVFNLASGGIPFFKAYLSDNGLDPETDVQMIPVGFGSSAVQAMNSGQVDALLFWGSANVAYANAGLNMRHLADPAWLTYPDFSMTALESTIEKDSAMLEGIARGAAKAIVFAIANPDCVRQLQWKNWPDTRPSGSDDEAVLAQWDVNILNDAVKSFEAARDMSPSKLWGAADAEAFERIQNFLLKTKLIEKTVPPENLVIQDPDFVKRVNDFDEQPIIASAKECKIS